ncbi:hypothetical protein [uncultured Methanobrevibacter sp.]|uniref:hypothetical protein n=1 Tax=uncultured Methanobrevibacter sp. TaxID=253161 RepID=UPI0025EAB7B7|nr:hypothetical protein [uncultured Methanobrevibacter sp.]
MITINDGGSIPDEVINNICKDYVNNVPVYEIKKRYDISNNRWHNILKRIYRTTGFKRKRGRPSLLKIDSEYVTKKGTRYNISKNGLDYGSYFKGEINEILELLESINFDYETWMSMKTKNIPEKALKEFIYTILLDNKELYTREISDLINNHFNKYYSVEYTRTLLHRLVLNEDWLICNNKEKTYHNKGIPLTWSNNEY